MADIMEEVVTHWLFSKGYFVINNLKVGNNEIDLLAVKVIKGAITEKLHIEIQAGNNPVGYIGGSSNAKTRSNIELEEGVAKYVEKKYFQNKIRDVVELYFGKEYEKWFVCGVLKDKSEITVEAFRKHKIKVKRIWDILEEYKIMMKDKKVHRGTAQGNRYHQLFSFMNKKMCLLLVLGTATIFSYFPSYAAQEQISQNKIDFVHTEALILKNEGKYLESEALFKQILAIQPQNSNARFDFGNVYLLQHKYNDALDCYGRAVKLDPNNEFMSDYYFNVAMCYIGLGKNKEAVEQLHQCLKTDSNRLDAKNLLPLVEDAYKHGQRLDISE